MKSADEKRCTFDYLVATDVGCLVCRQGVFEPARGRFGPIWRCSNRPHCTFTLTSRPTGERCSYEQAGVVCGALIVEGTKTIPDRCSRRDCPNRNPHELKRATTPAVDGGASTAVREG